MFCTHQTSASSACTPKAMFGKTLDTLILNRPGRVTTAWRETDEPSLVLSVTILRGSAWLSACQREHIVSTFGLSARS